MKVVEKRLLRRFHPPQVEREIEEELRFHLDQLTDGHIQQELSLAEATDAAPTRFGHVDQIKDPSVGITGRQTPLTLALKSFLVLVFLMGVLVRVFATEFHATHLGETLMLVAVSGRMLLYVRGLNPLSFGAKAEWSSPLMLNERARASASANDRRKLTPVERVISDE